MNECKVESIRGKDISQRLTLRAWFDWSIRSVQSFSYTGKMTRSTITQVVYERSYLYAHRAELEPLEAEVEKLKFPNPKPTVRALITMLILALVFGGIYLALPLGVSLLAPIYDATPLLPIFLWIFLILAGFFAAWLLPLLIIAIVRKVKTSKSKKKMEKIRSSILKIITTPAAAPVVHSAPVPVVHPSVPVTPNNELPKMPKVEKPLIRPLVKPIVTPTPSQPASPVPTAQVTEVKAPVATEPTPVKPIE